jgi:hypothetical protein
MYPVSIIISSESYVSEELESQCQGTETAGRGECPDSKGSDDVPNNGAVFTRARLQESGLLKDPAFAQGLINAHRKALAAYKAKPDTPRFDLLEQAGIWNIFDARPKGMTEPQYVQVLNDYAFFIHQYGDCRNLLAVELLDKVIRLAPTRRVAYLNMAQATEQAYQYPCVPMDSATVDLLKAKSVEYKRRYDEMASSTKK